MNHDLRVSGVQCQQCGAGDKDAHGAPASRRPRKMQEEQVAHRVIPGGSRGAQQKSELL